MPIIAFDLYGTLLSTDSIAAKLASSLGDDVPAGSSTALAALWRRYQLEYTWRINNMGHYRPLNTITRASLHHAAAELGLTLSLPTNDNNNNNNDDVEEVMMAAYNALHVFPEVPAALEAIVTTQKKKGGLSDDSVVEAYLFSNGTRDMIAASVGNSPDLLGMFSGKRVVVSVDEMEVPVYKPDQRAYEYLVREVGREGRPEEVWLVSANPFDALGAVAAGLRSVWVDRAGKGWVDRLGDVVGELRPTLVVSGVDEAVGEIMRMTA
ncbi:HAD-like domain-containing protein [Chaetomidium leptoderma]|uniref:HAD-like domain-containing protein n=1 Tax=Chaetomidium leptoderma TaxID=669021 RepID=A0AAN7A0M5_9PEZI|nr:HAD-like domain-containing protein [Chaetomidium leptoderma]